MEDKKVFTDGGMNLDDAIENIAPNDYIEAYNIKIEGVADNEAGNVTDIESNQLISFTLPVGINKTIKSEKFESIGKIIDFTYNSNGRHRINEYDPYTNIRTKLFENITDSAGIDILPLTPTTYVKDINLIDDVYLTFLPSSRVPSIINLNRLRSGGYGVLIEQDFMLIKQQPVKYIKPYYGSDAGASSNLMTGKSFVFKEQFIYLDNEPSSWSATSNRATPSGLQSSQTDVTKDVYQVIAVDAGTNRVKEIRIASLINSDTVWQEIRNVKRSYIIALTSTVIDVQNNIYEAYNPSTNEYIFVFYNKGAYQPIDVLETDLDHDEVPLKSEAMTLANGNVILLANNTQGYDLVQPSIAVGVSYESSGLQIVNTNADYIKITSFTNTNIKVAPNRYLLNVYVEGVVRTGDRIIISQRNRKTGEITTFDYLVPTAENGNTYVALNSLGALYATLGFTVIANGTGKWIFQFTSRTNAEPTSSNVVIFASTAGNFNSLPSLKLNSAYQLAIQYRDKYQRPFPLATDNNMKVTTLHFGATKGNVPVINWAINNTVPIGAVDYQMCLTYNLTHLSWLYINGGLVNNQGFWDAAANSPSLANNTGVITYYYTVNKSGDQNLGSGLISYKVGDIILFNGLTYDRIPYSNIQANGNVLNFNSADIMTIYVGSLNKFNKNNSSSVLSYGFTKGDRATIHYYKDSTNTTYLSNPAIDVEVVGYDPTLNILRVRTSSNLATLLIAGKELMVEIYTPKKSTDTADNIWYEIGDIYKISNGVHSTLTGSIRTGDSFIKTRKYFNALDSNVINNYLVEDANYSDFITSNYYPYGRPHIYNSLLKQITNKAEIRFSDIINPVTNINMLNRFYPEAVGYYDYTKGGIKIMVQRGNQLVTIQEFEFCYIPVFQNIIYDQAEQQNVAISRKLLNDARYPDNNQAGIGNATESYAYYKGTIYFIDPFRSEPCKIGYSGLEYIDGKLSKFFKRSIQADYKAGKKQIGWIDVFPETRYVLSTEYTGDIVKQISFNSNNWISQESYNYPLTYSLVSSLNGTTVISGNQATFTPTTDYLGDGNFLFSFNGTTFKIKNACIIIASGNTTVNQFYFVDLTNVALSTLYESNNIIVSNPNIPVPISITGGQWTKDNGVNWQSTAGTVIGNDIVKVRQQSSTSNNTTTNTTLTIATVSDTFSITTIIGGSASPINLRISSDQFVLCNNTPVAYYTAEGNIFQGVRIFTDAALTIPYSGGGTYVVYVTSIYNLSGNIVGALTGVNCP